MRSIKATLVACFFVGVFIAGRPATSQAESEQENRTLTNEDRIQPYKKNPRYWQYKGKPVLLLGGTDDDNLFQWTSSRLIEQLDLLKSVGGNYVRCTMSGRDEGNVWPFKQDNGKYDIDQWNEEYWNRFERMLKLIRDRDIVVQIEVWAFHDFNKGHWEKNPWRPAGNINYTESNTTLKDSYGNIGQKAHGFFFTVPKLKNDRVVLPFQQKFVDKILSHSLRYGHVLYCMTNEIHPQYSPEWGWYWAKYIKDKAAAKGKAVEVSEMLWEIDIKKKQQRASLDRPDIYSFFEASQNSAKMGQENWDNLQFVHDYLAEEPRPINHVKIYGADSSPWKGSTDRHATECFWRNIIGGSASSRFHRPPWGLGLSNKAQAHIKSLRMLTNEMDIFTCAPHNDLLSDRKPNEVYCLADPGKRYAVYFPNGGEAVLDIGLLKEPATIRWLEISTSKWGKRQELKPAQSVTLRPPQSGPWVVLVSKVRAGNATFTRTRLTTVAETNMGHVPVADINGDGVIDIVAGLQWFQGPSWRRHPLYPPDPQPTAIDIGFTVPYDLDGDGDLDLMTHRRSGDNRNKNELFWFENPGPPSTGAWTKHHITWDTKWPEVLVFVDIDGDGRDEMVCSDVCPGKGIRIYEIPRDPSASTWPWATVDKSPLHGLGIGDLNEDKRLDIVSDFVWFEQDASGGWIRHSLPSPGSARRGHETMQIKIYDVDADGDADLILPRAHHYGAYWLESSGGKKPSFKLHEILPGKLPSQLHGVAYGDIDGDGDLDIFAGKSRYRHGDPGNDEPLDVFWIELVRSSGPIRWVKHQLATDLTMGIGPTIADVDADGDMDLVLRGHGIGGRYVIGARQTDVTLFIQNTSVAASAKLTAKSARSITLRPPDSGPRVVPPTRETVLPYGKQQGIMKVIYDNDQTLDAYTDEVLMAMASAGRIQLVGMITTRTVNGIGYNKYDELVTQRSRMVNLARKSGMRCLPNPVKGPKVSLQPPASGRIEDTGTIGSEGSWLIVREARKASPSKPLVVFCGGQLTAVADAYLLDPSIKNKVIVAALLGSDKDMGGFNGLQDPWAAYVVLQRLTYVQFPERQATPKVPKDWLREKLPDTPLRQWMLAKIHPLFPKQLPGGADFDGQPVLPLLTTEYVTEVKRVAFGGWKSKRFGNGSVRISTFASVAEDEKSRALVVVRAKGNVGTRAWQAAMADPAAWRPTNGTSTRSSKRGSALKRSDRVRISPRNPRYFEYKQIPLFLTGARELEMLPRVGNYPYKQAVDRLAKAGCNHWRIEMYLSDSDQEGKRKYPIVSTYKSWWHDPATGKQEQLDAYRKNDQGKFDLNLFNEPFWNRFQDFCELCAKKGIVLTVEIWSTYAIWATSPFNPKNNINYSGPLDVGKHGRDADSEFSFVRTVPALGNRSEILEFQKKFAKKVLDCTWQAGNVLYVCGNENSWPREWVEYWADYVHKYGESKGVRLLYTNISEHVWHRASSGEVEYLFHPGMEDVLTRDRFDFADMSQLPGGKYPPSKLPKYETVVDWYERSKNTPRPITMLKNYIGMDEKADVGEKRRDALTYFMAGAAMSGFHRPWAGGCPEGRWNNCAEKMRKVYLSSLEAAGQVATFTSGVEFVDTTRRNDLVNRGWCLAKPPKHYIIYLKEGGESVDVKLKPDSYRCKAFDGHLWSREDKFEWPGGWRTFSKAGNEDWGIYIVREEPQTH